MRKFTLITVSTLMLSTSLSYVVSAMFDISTNNGRGNPKPVVMRIASKETFVSSG